MNIHLMDYKQLLNLVSIIIKLLIQIAFAQLIKNIIFMRQFVIRCVQKIVLRVQKKFVLLMIKQNYVEMDIIKLINLNLNVINVNKNVLHV